MTAAAFLNSALALAMVVPALAAPPLPPLSPWPSQVEPGTGAFRAKDRVRLEVPGGDPEDRFAASLLAKDLRDLGLETSPAGGAPAIRLVRLGSGTQGQDLPAQARAEGYALRVEPDGIRLLAATSAGMYYGVQTLRQLIHAAPGGGAEAPAVRIVDWPALPWRGVSVDVSRGPIPTLAALERQVEQLAEFKVNVFSLYFESSYAYPGLPLMAQPGGAVTEAEARELVAFAAQHHVLVIPQQEALGHLHIALQNEAYQDMAELPYGHVLSPKVPRTFDLLGRMFGDLARTFPGPFLHVGADEATELGMGRAKAEVDRDGYGKVYIGALNRIHQTLAPLHRRLLFWGDMGVQHPECLKDLPKDMIAVPWGYDPEPSYVNQIKPFRDAGLETWVAPGVSNWSRIFPDYALAFPNIRQYAEDAKTLGATGLLNTMWMDDGEGLVDATWYGLGYGAAHAWQAHVDDAQFADAWDWVFHRAPGHHVAQAMDRLTEIHRLLSQCLDTDGQDWLYWLDPLGPEGRRTYARMLPQARRIRLLAEEVVEDLALNGGLARRNADLLPFLDFAARRFDLLGQKAIYAATIPELYAKVLANLKNPDVANDLLYRINGGSNGLIVDLRNQAAWMKERYRALWLAANRPFFLENILLRYTNEMIRLQAFSDRLTALHRGYADGGGLPAFEDLASR